MGSLRVFVLRSADPQQRAIRAAASLSELQPRLGEP